MLWNAVNTGISGNRAANPGYFRIVMSGKNGSMETKSGRENNEY